MPLPKLRHDEVCLPNADDHADRRAEHLSEAQDAYRYTFDKPNLRGVAMVAQMPKSDRPDPGWLADVVGAVGKIIDNAEAHAKARGDTPRKDLRKMVGAVEEEGIERALADLGQAVTQGRAEGPVQRFAEYAELFQAWPLPSAATEHQLDSTFARMRVAGPNPAWIRRVDPKTGLPDDFGVEERHYQAAIGDPKDSLEAALAEGRLFLAEYRQLLGAKPGCSPVPPKISIDYAQDPGGWDAAYKARQASYANLPGSSAKLVVAPLALFTIPRGSGALSPVAIQLFPNGHGGADYPVFTPLDGNGWYAAKLAVQAADGNVHEAIAHLGTTHLVQEAFMLAMHNCLAPNHPLNRLLEPHFEGTASINSAADSSLVAPGGGVDCLLMPTIGDLVAVSAAGLRAWDFNEEIFPRQLARRGVDDAALLQDYPYRDDGLLVWRALEQWVEAYVHHYYTNDAAVAGDRELQAFVRQVGAYKVEDARGRVVGGGIKGVGEDGAEGGVATRAYLVQMVTQIIWNGSAQHAAVNFPQAHEMAYAPLYSLALMGALPGSAHITDAEIFNLLTRREVAHQQLVLTELLGSVYHTRLGHYPEGPLRSRWFGRGPVHELELGFQARLDDVERTIDARNQERPTYRYLRPSEIPQSINI